MTADLVRRLGKVGALLAERMPSILDAAIAFLESVPAALNAARPERYQIECTIGVGGQAEVLRALVRGADGFHRPIAIKRMRSDVTRPGMFSRSLIEEARLAAGLSHPNVVSVLDFDRDKAGQPFLVMELVAGIDLDKLIESGPLPHPIAIFIVRELLAGLGYLHEPRNRGRGRVQGLVHRDVSPNNVLLSWEGEVKLADFGVARKIVGARAAATSVPVGKIGYMSPEQVSCDEVDGRSDLYAVGIVLWEILARRRLPAPLGGNRRETVAFEVIPPPSEYQQDVPADLEAIVMRLLAFDRDVRYRTAEIAAHDLMRCKDLARDGRGELVRLLEDRFPSSRRRQRARPRRR